MSLVEQVSMRLRIASFRFLGLLAYARKLSWLAHTRSSTPLKLTCQTGCSASAAARYIRQRIRLKAIRLIHRVLCAIAGLFTAKNSMPSVVLRSRSFSSMSQRRA